MKLRDTDELQEEQNKKSAVRLILAVILFLLSGLTLFIAVMAYIYFVDSSHPLATVVMESIGQWVGIACTGLMGVILLGVAVKVLGTEGLKRWQ